VNSMFKVIVAGGRDFSDYQLLCSTLNHLLSRKTDVEIVSGVARGADSLAIRYAGEKKIPVKKFPADWDRDGNSAGYKRNVVMAEYADACICFWDGISKGTADMIRVANDYGLQVRVIKYRKP
jgi:hypothetical protein